jgi:hypothetical protein
MSNMPKMAKSIPVNAQEGYIPVLKKKKNRNSGTGYAGFFVSSKVSR